MASGPGKQLQPVVVLRQQVPLEAPAIALQKFQNATSIGDLLASILSTNLCLQERGAIIGKERELQD